VPLEARRLPTGFTALQARLLLEVRNRFHQFEPIPFIVDPGSNITTIPLQIAQECQLSLPARTFVLEVQTSGGLVRQRLRPDKITVRIPTLAARDFYWPCHFVEEEGAKLKPALGLAGILDDLRLIFDGAYSLEAPHGCLIIEEVARNR
jgi:hypothetical protein